MNSSCADILLFSAYKVSYRRVVALLGSDFLVQWNIARPSLATDVSLTHFANASISLPPSL